MKLEHDGRQNNSDPFGLRGLNLSVRIPEEYEMFPPEEAIIYIEGCDYPESVDDLLLAWETERLFGPTAIRGMKILDLMCGPGRLGRELLNLGAQHVMFQDGDETMITHARNEAFKVMQSGQSLGFVTSDVDNITLPDNTFDLVICHNATHQLSSNDRLPIVMNEFLRITAPLGHVVIADYQRNTTPEFIELLEERLRATKPEVVPLLIPSFTAAFSKKEFSDVVSSMSGVRRWSVIDAPSPVLDPMMRQRVDQDFVKGHLMDFSAISQRVILQKESI